MRCTSIFFEISADATQVVYMADATTVDLDEVFVTPITGPASAAEKISGPMAGGGGARDIWFSPDSQTILYTADQESATNAELYATGVAPGTSFAAYLPIVVRKK